jgi:hypothetical protein
VRLKQFRMELKRELDLSGNKIQYIDNFAFLGLPYLNIFYFGGSKIIRLHVITFTFQ